MPDEFLTVAEIAAMLKVNQMTVRNWIDAGKLPAYHIGRRVRVGREDFEQFIERGRTGRVEPPASPNRASGTARSRRHRFLRAPTRCRK
jgi:putative molybdopterin biosynthesis protein